MNDGERGIGQTFAVSGEALYDDIILVFAFIYCFLINLFFILATSRQNGRTLSHVRAVKTQISPQICANLPMFSLIIK